MGALFERFPVGWSEAAYDDRTWAVTRQVTAGGRAEKLLAEELGGTDLVSANLYRTAGADLLKPCEMPAEKVLDFLRDAAVGDSGPATGP